MKNISERHLYIKEQLDRNGFVYVQDLAEQLGVTGATIRRDLRMMEEENLLRRNHGGASPVRALAIELPLDERNHTNQDKKNRIAQAACSLLTGHDSIAVTSGSTIEAFVRMLQPSGPLNVVTPSVRLGVLFGEKKDVEVLMLGGRLVMNSMSVRDAYSLYGLRNVRCTKVFFSCDGFDLEGGVMSAFVEEARLTEALMGIAAQKILLADSTKVGKTGFGKICALEDIDVLVTDEGLSEGMKSRIEGMGVEVIMA